jgi:hypothetical protein
MYNRPAMGPSRHVMMPLWSPIVAIVVGILALTTAVLVLDRGSYVATVRIERHEPPIDRAAHEEPPLLGGPSHTVPATRIHATYVLADGSLLRKQVYKGELRAVYQHATSEVKPGISCNVTLSDPRPESGALGMTVAIRFLAQSLLGGDSGPPSSEHLWVHGCDESTGAELAQVAARLDAWLVDGAHGMFEDRIGSRWRAAPWALLVLIAFLALVAPLRLFRIEIEAWPQSLRLVRRFGPVHRVIAEVLTSEIKAVRVAARELGPLTLHRPTLALGDNRVVELWPVGRIGLVRAFEARDALERLIAACPRGEGGAPFRGEA